MNNRFSYEFFILASYFMMDLDGKVSWTNVQDHRVSCPNCSNPINI